MTNNAPPAQSADREAGWFGFRPVDPAQKAGMVRDVFDSVASSYDVMNDAMSLGVHRLWKAALVDWVAPRAGRKYLDVAGGTGDIAFRILQRAPGALVTIADINERMVSVGRDRALDRGLQSGLSYLVADAQRLPIPDSSVDTYTIAFGLRNVTHIDQALADAFRVLRPGGRFFCLEFSHVNLPGLDKIYDLYSFKLLPELGALIAKDRESYKYLVESIRRFPPQEELAARMRGVGFERVEVRNLSGGIAAIHSGWKL
jgi:demethylmenaquinone methyltransferase/2-methoxy-6-polyprenyl-1,4-benzoquinol methylase